MTEHKPSGTGWPEPGAGTPDAEAAQTRTEPEPESVTGDASPVPDGGSSEDLAPAEDERPAAAKRRLTSAGVVIAVLLALLGFTLVVQVKSNSTDSGLASARQEDLVRILSDLEAREERLRDEIADLEESQRQLTSGAEGRQAALDEATRRADELGVLAGTLPARGPGLTVLFQEGSERLAASAVLDAVQELRGAGAEAMQIAGSDGTAVRIVASTWFLDADGGIAVDGRRLSAPYTVTVIGEPRTMETALKIPGGVVESVENDNGTVIVQEHEVVDVSALRAPTSLQHARPTS
ncbi:DUF881 domain-containing protein [Phytohabitans sp. ZYX-F-186]|uniref:DUF881 domain-containing protein n=1 Tax=Phytohabitans maris TaxID=3071409 RepID=A0ABU0ZRM7_9ACTN|nr:DUF881 domain-containing protein [Phytohabitans sp. ZYX-F-186]MDQ7908602.1 DUF881 domain-containing protein [Phytohabitans sp. ZYX-F-186]